MDDMIPIKFQLSSCAMVIAGMYCGFNNVNAMAIPESLWYEIAEKLAPYLKEWDYSLISFEDFIHYRLMIAPKELFSEEELNDLMESTEYFERKNGNVVLVCAFEV